MIKKKSSPIFSYYFVLAQFKSSSAAHSKEGELFPPSCFHFGGPQLSIVYAHAVSAFKI